MRRLHQRLTRGFSRPRFNPMGDAESWVGAEAGKRRLLPGRAPV
jgi:hypothetical protein